MFDFRIINDCVYLYIFFFALAFRFYFCIIRFTTYIWNHELTPKLITTKKLFVSSYSLTRALSLSLSLSPSSVRIYMWSCLSWKTYTYNSELYVTVNTHIPTHAWRSWHKLQLKLLLVFRLVHGFSQSKSTQSRSFSFYSRYNNVCIMLARACVCMSISSSHTYLIALRHTQTE